MINNKDTSKRLNHFNLNHVAQWPNHYPQYRYLTLGLHRANMAKLAALNPAQNQDGNLPFYSCKWHCLF